MTNETCKTVLIKSKNGPVRVNESDYLADQAEGGANEMTLHKDDAKEQPEPVTANTVTIDPNKPVPVSPSAPNLIAPENPVPPGPAAPVVASPNTRSIAKQGKKWFIVNENGERLTEFPGLISDKGYDTEEEARHVLTLLPR